MRVIDACTCAGIPQLSLHRLRFFPPLGEGRRLVMGPSSTCIYLYTYMYINQIPFPRFSPILLSSSKINDNNPFVSF